MTRDLGPGTDLSDPRVAATFDELTVWSSMFGQLLLRHVPLAPGLAVLDVGCGTGFPLLELADRLGPSSVVHGLDAWDLAVERARRKADVRGAAHVHVTHGDAARMPYDDASFDLIVSNVGLNNFSEPARVMAECRRVCRPGGRLALTTNLVGHMRELYDAFAETLEAVGHADRVERLREQEAHRATPDGLRALLADGDFEVTALRTEEFELRYADGAALLRAYLTRVGFLDGWLSVLDGTEPAGEAAVLADLEARLDRRARGDVGGLRLRIPAAYVEGRRVDGPARRRPARDR